MAISQETSYHKPDGSHLRRREEFRKHLDRMNSGIAPGITTISQCIQSMFSRIYPYEKPRLITSNFRIYAIKTQHLAFMYSSPQKKESKKERKEILTILQSPGKTKSQLLIIRKLRDRVSKEDKLIDWLVDFWRGDSHFVSFDVQYG